MKRCAKCAEKIQAAAVVCRYCGAPQPNNSQGSLGLWICGAIAAIVLLSAVSPDPDKGVQQEPERRALEDSEVAPDAVSLMTKEQYPKMYARLGGEGFANANSKTMFAANRASRVPSCERVEAIGVSDRSTPTTIEWFVDCPKRRIRLRESGDGFAIVEDRELPW